MGMKLKFCTVGVPEPGLGSNAGGAQLHTADIAFNGDLWPW
jgi:hypothetical protein